MRRIRLATLADAKALLDIYRPYVEETAVSFEYTVPSLTEFEQRLSDIMAFYPCLVAEEEGGILGYAYASRFHARAAYAWSAEVTIYLAQEARGRGLGSALYHRLEGYLKGMGILNCNACIASTAHATPYLTNSSQAFHEKLGYRLVGRFHQSGYKFNQWFDMIWMEKLLGEHDVPPRPVMSFRDLLCQKHQSE